MTLWEEVQNRYPGLRDTFGELDIAVGLSRELGREFPPIPPEFHRQSANPPSGIYGYGLWVLLRATVPAVIVEAGLAPPGGAPIGMTAFGTIGPGAQTRWPQGVIAVGLPTPRPQIRKSTSRTQPPDQKVIIGGERATLGLRIGTRDCPEGVTTAGHAAQLTPTMARDRDGTRVGLVTESVSPFTTEGRQPTADIALIEVDPDYLNRLEDPVFRLGAARSYDRISIHSGRNKTWVRGLMPEFALDLDLSPWGEVAITATAISAAGDSGSIVRREDDGAAIGQIVAGHEGAYSIVQDIEYGLRALNAFVK